MAQAGVLSVPWPLFGLIGAVLVLLGAAPLPFVLQNLWRVRRALRFSERQLQALSEATVDYALFLLDESGNVSEWGAGAERLHGFAAAEIVGRHYSSLFSLEDRAARLPQQVLELSARDGRFAFQGWRLRRDGARFCAETLMQARRDGAARLIGFNCVERDISARLRGEEALEQAHDALLQAQRFAALGRVSDGVAHEFNNVAHVIRTCVEALQAHLAARPQALEFLQMIKRNSERAATLSRQLLGLARRSRQSPVATDVNEVVTEVVTLLRQTLNEDVMVELRLDEGLSWAVVDRSELEAALVNLVADARDALAGAGLLSVTTATTLRPEGAVDEDTHTPSRQCVVISVSCTRGVRDATPGLGLSLARNFAEQAGGGVVREEELEGATVRLYLPVAPSSAAVISPPERAPERAPPRSRS